MFKNLIPNQKDLLGERMLIMQTAIKFVDKSIWKMVWKHVEESQQRRDQVLFSSCINYLFKPIKK